jgi:asparagine synthase (glutamine-hydrolysing)
MTTEELGGILDPSFVAQGLACYSALEDATEALRGVEGEGEAVAVLEQSMYMRNQLLRDTDWASMAHSLEVRVPLVDRELYSRVAGPTLRARFRPAKRPLAAAAGPVLEDHLRRPKSGFGFPFQQWLREGRWDPFPRELPRGLASPAFAETVRRWRSLAAEGRLHWSRPWAVSVLGQHLERAS